MESPVSLPITAPLLDLAERGRSATGEEVRVDRRLFVQLLAFTGCRDTAPLVETLAASGLVGALYANVLDPYGVAVATFSEDEQYFLDAVRPTLTGDAFAALTPVPALTMFGRTYAIGHERDIEYRLVDRPAHTITNPAWPWAVWYPLRRSGRFEQLPADEQRKILMEHGGIGHTFGRADYAHDIRLSCHGLDTHDNDFVTGLFGPRLHPLSAVVQHMRKTKQTSLYLDQLGPFFVGKAVWQQAPAHLTVQPDHV